MTQTMPTNYQRLPPEEQESSNNSFLDVTTGITWGLLNQHHSCYDAITTDKYKLLLHGGPDIKKNAGKFIKQFAAESTKAYKDRVSFAAYENNFGSIINELGSNLFAKPLAIMPATDGDNPATPGQTPDDNSPHMLLQTHFTLDDQKMDEFLKDIQEESNAIGCAYFGMNFDENQTPFAYYIDPCSVLDWQKDDQGNFIFLVLRDDSNVRTAVRQLRNTITTTFTVWTKDDNDQIKYELYQVTYDKGKEPPDEQVIFQVKVQDPTVSFLQIPIIDCQTPDNLCIGKLIGELQASLFMRYTTFLFCLNRGINPILVYSQGAELPANGDLSIVNEDEARGDYALRTATARGAALLGPNDNLNFVGPDKGPYEVVQQQLEQDKNEMYRLVSQMNSIINKSGMSTSQTRESGVAKAIDNQAKEYLLTAYAKLVKKWAVKAFKLVFDALSQDVEWKPQGMDNYKVVDQDQLLAKIAALPIYRANVPSLTSYQQLLNDVAYEAHPFTSPAILTVIQQELMDAVKKMQPAPDPLVQQQQQQNQLKASKGNSQASGNQNYDGQDVAELGPSGQPLMPEGGHLQTGEHIDARVVYDQLSKDYNDKDIQFVLTMSWKGPMDVPLSSIDFSNKDNWQATQETEQVDQFADKMSNDNFTKPIILVGNPSNNNKYVVVDGHHRALAALQNGQPVSAYIGEATSDHGPWDKLHSKQIGSKLASMQKEVSNQVNKSEMAKNGKTN